MAKTMTLKPVLVAGADPAVGDQLAKTLQDVVGSGLVDHIAVSIDGKHVGNMIADEIITPHGRYKAHPTDPKQDTHHPHPHGHHHTPGEHIFHLRERN